MKTQLSWMIGLGLLSFTLVTVGTARKPRDAQAAADAAPLCAPVAAPAKQQAVNIGDVALQGVGTGGAAGAGPPLNGAAATRSFAIAAAAPKAPTSTSLVFLPLGARQ